MWSYILVGWLTFTIGFLVGFAVKIWLARFKSYDGVILITSNDEKTVFSLEIGMDPDLIKYEEEILLKVDTSGESSESQVKHAL